MNIRYVKWGLANNFGDVIELNENLKDYPELIKPILAHEVCHTDRFFTVEDLMLDITATHDLDQAKLIKFMLKHPRSLTQLLPVYYSPSRGFVYDVNAIIAYVMYLTFIFVGIVIGWKLL